MEWAVFITLIAVYGSSTAMSLYEALRTKTLQERMQQHMQEAFQQIMRGRTPANYVFIDLTVRSPKEKVDWAKEGF